MVTFNEASDQENAMVTTKALKILPVSWFTEGILKPAETGPCRSCKVVSVDRNLQAWGLLGDRTGISQGYSVVKIIQKSHL